MPDSKSIIFFGRTGVGKSSISTMLYQKKIDKKDNPFPIGDGAVGVTADFKQLRNDHWNIYDTIGLGEPPSGSVPHDIAKQRIMVFLKNIRVPFHYICIVKKKGRLDQLDEIILKTTKTIFAGAERNMVLIITDADQKWLNENAAEIKAVYGDIPTFAVSFPPIHDNDVVENIFKDSRQTSLETLTGWFSMLDYKPVKADICFHTQKQLEEVGNQVLKLMINAGKILATGALIGAGAMVVLAMCTIQ